MGGEVPAGPVNPAEPTVGDWKAFMDALSNAGAEAVVSMVITDATTNPTVRDFRVPAGWIKVEPRFTVQPPVVDPPPTPVPQPVTMFVVSAAGVRVHNATDTLVGSREGSLPFRSQVKVGPDTVTANKYIWRILAAGEPMAGMFVAEKSTDGTEVLLSATPPK